MSIRNKIKLKQQRESSRAARVRAKVFGVGSKPRLCVSRSNKHITAQLIDDQKGVTLAVTSDLGLEKTPKVKETGELSGKRASAYEVGIAIAKKAIDLKTKKVVFDRGSHRYHGRVKSLAEGARKGGLEF